LFQGKPTLAENLPLKVFTAALIILSLVNIGAIFEKKTWVTALEYLRILAVSGLIVLLAVNTSIFVPAIVSVGLFSVISILWFTRFKQEFSTKTI
jgi:hypothetical protein